MMSFNRTNLVQGAARSLIAVLFLDGPKVATSCSCWKPQTESAPPAGRARGRRERKDVPKQAPRAWHNELEHSNRSHNDYVTIIDRSRCFGEILRVVDEDLSGPYFSEPVHLYGCKEKLIKDVLECIQLDRDRAYKEGKMYQSNFSNPDWEHSVRELLGKLDVKELRKKSKYVIKGDDDEDAATILETSQFTGIIGSAGSYEPRLFVHEKIKLVHELVGGIDFQYGREGKPSVLTFYTASGFADDNYKRGTYKSYKIVFVLKKNNGRSRIRMFYRVSEGLSGKCELKVLSSSQYETLFTGVDWI